MPRRACLAALLVLCSAWIPGRPVVLAAPELPEFLNLAILLPTSGELGTIGNLSVTSAMIAVDWINNDTSLLPNITLQAFHKDTATDPATCVRAALDLIEEHDIHGIVGEMFSSVTLPLALLAQSYDIPTVSPASTSSLLSNKAFFPFFLRTVPSDSMQALALVDLALSLGWHTISMVHSLDAYGSAFVTSVNSAIADKPMRVDVTAGFTPQDADEIREAVRQVRNGVTRILLVVCLQESFHILAKTMDEMGMIGKYVLLGVDGWVLPDTINSFPGDQQAMTQWMQGVLGTSFFFENSSALMALNAECLLRNPLCADPDSTMYTTFDAVYLFAHGFAELLHEFLNDVNGSLANVTDIFNGEALVNAMRHQVFEGISGTIRLDASYDNRGAYRILNMIDGVLVPRGVWIDVDSPGEQALQMTSAPVFFDGTTNVPKDIDIAPRYISDLSTDFTIVSIFFSCLGIIYSIALHVILHRYRDAPPVKAGSRSLLHVMVAGTYFAYLFVIVRALGEDEVWKCVTSSLFLELGFFLVFTPIFFKTFRISIIFNSRKFTRLTVHDSKLLSYIAAVVCGDIFFFTIWQIADPRTPSLGLDPSDRSMDEWTCKGDNEALWLVFILGPKAVLVIWGSIMAFKVRNVHKAFNESRYLGSALYNLIFMSVLVVPLALWLNVSYQTRQYFVVIGTLAVTLFTVSIIILPKIWKYYRPSPTDEKGSSTSRTSKEYGHGTNSGSAQMQRPQYAAGPNASAVLIEMTPMSVAAANARPGAPEPDPTQLEGAKHGSNSSIQPSPDHVLVDVGGELRQVAVVTRSPAADQAMGVGIDPAELRRKAEAAPAVNSAPAAAGLGGGSFQSEDAGYSSGSEIREWRQQREEYRTKLDQQRAKILFYESEIEKLQAQLSDLRSRRHRSAHPKPASPASKDGQSDFARHASAGSAGRHTERTVSSRSKEDPNLTPSDSEGDFAPQ